MFEQQSENSEHTSDAEREDGVLYGTQTFKQEIFAQNSASRKLFLKHERTAASRMHFLDPLLERLCAQGPRGTIRDLPGYFWSVSCKTAEGHLQEQDVYSVTSNFPILGPRLRKLEAYSLRQTPSKIRDLWRDFRSPLQWYTFWAVVLFGGLGIVLAILQTLLAVARVVSTYECSS